MIASSPPAITGIGNSSGFDMELQDHGGIGHTQLIAMRDKLLELADRNPRCRACATTVSTTVRSYKIDVDQRKAQALRLIPSMTP